MIGRQRYYPAHPLTLAGRQLTDAARGRGDLVTLGRKLLRDIADLSHVDAADLTLTRRADVVLAWVRTMADPNTSATARQSATSGLERLDAELSAEEPDPEPEDTENGR